MHQIEAPWAKIPEAVISDPQLTRADLRVYWYIDYRAGKSGKWFGGMQEIATVLGCSTRSVERSVAKLVEREFILKHRQGMQRMTRNLYYVLARTTEVPLPSKRSDSGVGSVPTVVSDLKTQTTDTDHEEEEPKRIIRPSDVFLAIGAGCSTPIFHVQNMGAYDAGFRDHLDFDPAQLTAFVKKIEKMRLAFYREDLPLHVPDIGRCRALFPVAEFVAKHKRNSKSVKFGLDELWGELSAGGVNVLTVIADHADQFLAALTETL